MRRPRHYVADILKLKTKEDRRTALEKVPAEYQKIVRKNVENHFMLRRYKNV